MISIVVLVPFILSVFFMVVGLHDNDFKNFLLGMFLLLAAFLIAAVS